MMELTKRDIRQYVYFLSEVCGYSNNRINRLLSVCRSVFNFLSGEEQYGYTSNLAPKIKNLPKEGSREIVFLDNETIMMLYKYFMDSERYRDATLLALAYESAGRKSELIQVTKDSVNKHRNNTNVVIGKRSKKFPLIYFELTQKAAEKYLKQRGDDNNPYLFITDKKKRATPGAIYEWVRSWREDVFKLTGQKLLFNVHSFRHSALQNYESGTHEVCKKRKVKNITIEQLSVIAHHESVEVTLSYLKKDNEDLMLEQLFKINIQKNL